MSEQVTFIAEEKDGMINVITRRPDDGDRGREPRPEISDEERLIRNICGCAGVFELWRMESLSGFRLFFMNRFYRMLFKYKKINLMLKCRNSIIK